MGEVVSFTEAIYHATKRALSEDESLRVLGLGVSYPGGADGTLGDLGQLFPNRVLDTPVSEAAVTGLGLGASIAGVPMVVHHGRVEFALFAIDQIATQAAKWDFMFGGGSSIPLTIRVALGRQWGNGPQHTQHLLGLWGGITGLKVVVPSSPNQAAKLMYWSIKHPCPVVYLEPRWLYKTSEFFDVANLDASPDLQSSRIVRSGKDFTFVGYGEGVLELLKLAEKLESTGETADVIDIVMVNPLMLDQVIASVKLTGRLVVLDMGGGSFSVASEVLAGVLREAHSKLLDPPLVLSVPHSPVPTATGDTEAYYPNAKSISARFNDHFSRDTQGDQLSFDDIHLPPRYVFGSAT